MQSSVTTFPQVDCVDYYDQVDVTDDSTQCTIDLAPRVQGHIRQVPVDIQNNMGTAVRGRVKFTSFSVKGDAGDQFHMQVSCSSFRSRVPTTVVVRPCRPGAALDPQYLCKICPEGTYSPTGMACLPCPPGGVCKHVDFDGKTIGTVVPATKTGWWLYEAPYTRLRDFCSVGGGKECKYDDPARQNCWKYNTRCKDQVERCALDESGTHCDETKSCVPLVTETAATRFNCIESAEHPETSRLHFYRCVDRRACKGLEKFPGFDLTSRNVSSQIKTMWVRNEVNPLAVTPVHGSEKFSVWGGDSSCHEGYRGPKCSRCQKGWYRAASGCLQCIGGDTEREVSITIYVGMATMASAVMITLLATYLQDDGETRLKRLVTYPVRLCCRSRKLKKVSSTKVHVAGQKDTEEAAENQGAENSGAVLRVEKFKVMLTWMQIFAQIKSNYNIPWHHVVTDYMEYFAVVNIDLLEVMAVECLVPEAFTAYWISFRTAMAIPIVGLLLLVLISVVGRQVYHFKLLRIPRRCILTGEPVRVWLKKSDFQRLRYKLTKDALEKAEAETGGGDDVITDAMVKAEMKESDIGGMLSPSGSVLPGASRKLGIAELKEVLIHNRIAWKKRVLTRLNYIMYHNKLWKLYFWLLLLSYPSATTRIMRVFKCEPLGRRSFLTAHLETRCYNSEHQLNMVIAGVGVVVFVVGIPAFIIGILWKARNKNVGWKCKQAMHNETVKEMMLHEAKIDSHLNRKIWIQPNGDKEALKVIASYVRTCNFRSFRVFNRFGMVYFAYAEHAWYYEVVELLRRFCLNGLIVLIYPGEAFQVVVGIVFCLFFLVLVMWTYPYKLRSDQALANAAHLQLLVTLLCGLQTIANIHYLGGSTDPAKHDREKAISGMVVVVSSALLCLFWFLSVVYEAFVGVEQRRSKRFRQLRDLQLKRTRKKQQQEQLQQLQQQALHPTAKQPISTNESKAADLDLDALLHTMASGVNDQVSTSSAAAVQQPLPNNDDADFDDAFASLLDEHNDDYDALAEASAHKNELHSLVDSNGAAAKARPGNAMQPTNVIF